jgi:hypothetical protein
MVATSLPFSAPINGANESTAATIKISNTNNALTKGISGLLTLANSNEPYKFYASLQSNIPRFALHINRRIHELHNILSPTLRQRREIYQRRFGRSSLTWVPTGPGCKVRRSEN